MSDESKPETTTDKYISRIKNHPLIAVLLIVVAVLGGAEATTKAISGLVDTYLDISGKKNKPTLVQFTLNHSKSTYIEDVTARFGAGPQVKTFMAHFKDPNANSFSSRASYPVFNVVIENPSSQQLIITKITYNIEDIGQVMGGGPGPLEAAYRYTHKLEYKKGIQEYELVPTFMIPAKSSGAFELAMFTDHPDLGLCWWMNIEFNTNRGNVSTDMFQVILSGRPEWAVKAFEPQQVPRQRLRMQPFFR